ncbi:MAG: NADH-quinone oxidoreductase subunit NuoK [Planctomycetota bacterium]
MIDAAPISLAPLLAVSLSDAALGHFQATAAVLFCLGLVGFVTRRNLIVMFLCTEMMFQGVAISLIAFSAYHGNVTGQTFVIFVLTIAAAEAALALGLVVMLFRRRRTLDAEAWAQLHD